MIPAVFDYRRAESVPHVLELLEQCDAPTLLAGGHSLVPLLKLRLAVPGTLIDIAGLRELSYIRSTGDELAIGALTRHHDLERSELLRAECPLLAQAAALVGDPQVRHCGTIGGSVAHADPASDLPAVLLALDARFVVVGPTGERVIAADAFFQGFLTTTLSPGELLTEVRVRRAEPGTGSCYVKFNRRSQDWATVGVAVVLKVAESAVDHASVGLANMGPTPLRARMAEAELAGAQREAGEARLSAEVVTHGTSPPSDTSASAEYRAHLVTVLTRRAFRRALADADEKEGAWPAPGDSVS